MKAQWLAEVAAIVARIVPGLIREWAQSDNDSQQFQRLNEIEARLDKLESKAKAAKAQAQAQAAKAGAPEVAP